MKRLLILIGLFFLLKLNGQTGLYRSFSQASLVNSGYFTCDMADPQKTSDGGYVFSYYPWSANLHGPGPYDQYTIKTDSSFVPQWKKYGDKKAVVLPTGCIVTYYSYPMSPQVGTIIEKVTRSGVQVWVRQTSADCMLNDGVSYNNKIRFVGRKQSPVPFMPFQYYSQPYSLEMDTLGNFISGSLLAASNATDCAFTKIERDLQGNFLLLGFNFSIAKMDSNFTFVYGKNYASGSVNIPLVDIDLLSTGGMLASGIIGPYSMQPTSTLIKFDSQGNLYGQIAFKNRGGATGLCKKPNWHYVMSLSKADSLFMFDADTLTSISWYKLVGRGKSIGTSVVKNSLIYTPIFSDYKPVLISNDLNGSSCMSYSIPSLVYTPTISTTSFSLASIVFSSTLSTVTFTSNPLTQNYVDSCACNVFVSVNQNNLCVGNTGTIMITGHGNLSWYSTPTGSTFIQSGSQFVYSSKTPTIKTVYAQDSSCAIPNRTAINIVVHGVPTLTFSPLNPTICAGSQVFLWAYGATNYTWSNTSQNTSVQNLNPLTSIVYTVTGAVAPGCSTTQTVSITVTPLPTLSISPASTICIGNTVTLSIGGANTYTWSYPGSGSSQNSPSITLSPMVPGFQVYTAYGSNSFCNSSAQTTVFVAPNPSISILANPQTFCAGVTSTLTANGATSYTWNTSSLTSTIAVTPLSNTSYTVSGKNLYNCVNTQTASLAVFPQPTLSLSPLSQSVCVGDQVTVSVSGANTYSWNNGNLSNMLTVTAIPGKSHYYITGANGTCSKTTFASIYASAIPTISFVNTPLGICMGKSATLTASGATNYTWNTGDYSSNIVVTPSSSTNYIVSGANGGCIRTDSIILAVYPNPTLILSLSGQSVCFGQPVTILANGASTYTWNTGVTVNLVSYYLSHTTDFSVTGSNAFGCTDTKAVSIYVNPLPTLTLSSSNTTICGGQSSTLTASGASSYSWNALPGSTSSVVSPLVNTTYTVVGIDVNGCKASTTILQQVTICTALNVASAEGSFVSVFPNPNQGTFGIHLGSWHTEIYLEIYSSVGQLVQSQKLQEQSTLIDIKHLASGIYYLKITGSEKCSMIKLLKD